MTKAEIVAQISRQSGIEKTVVMTVVESFMENVKESMVAGNEVFLRGFGSYPQIAAGLAKKKENK